MSRFLEQVEEEVFDVRIPSKWSSLLRYEAELDPSSIVSFSDMRRYKFSVNYVLLAECHPKNVKDMKKNFIEQLRHDIYGDFLNKIYRLQRSIMEQDSETAESICRDLLVETRGH